MLSYYSALYGARGTFGSESMDYYDHGPWIFLVAVPIFVIFGFRSFLLFTRGKRKRDGR